MCGLFFCPKMNHSLVHITFITKKLSIISLEWFLLAQLYLIAFFFNSNLQKHWYQIFTLIGTHSFMFQCFNLFMNLKLTMPLCLVFDSNMFPRSYNPSNEPKSPLSGALSLEFLISPLPWCNIFAKTFVLVSCVWNHIKNST